MGAQHSFHKRLFVGEHGSDFTVMSYNILAPSYVHPEDYKDKGENQNKSQDSDKFLSWIYRKKIIWEEIKYYNPDIICLQEVENHVFKDLISENPKYHGFWEKKYLDQIDGCAIVFRKDVFRVIPFEKKEYLATPLQPRCLRYPDVKSFYEKKDPEGKSSEDKYPLVHAFWNQMEQKENIAMVVHLEHQKTGKQVLVANCHLYHSPQVPHIKVMQTQLLLKWLENLRGENPLILGGDFNSLPRQVVDHIGMESREGVIIKSGVYELITTGNLSSLHKHHPYWRLIGATPLCLLDDLASKYERKIARCQNKGLRDEMEKEFFEQKDKILDSADLPKDCELFSEMKHNLVLSSAYRTILGSEPEFTNYTQFFQGTLDYLYCSDKLKVTKVLRVPEKGILGKFCPNAVFPSDHLPIMAGFCWK